MGFSPILPLSGLGGWRLLTATMERQREVHDAAPQATRDVARLKERLPAITSAEDLVADRKVLRVALTAYGLEDDLNAGALIRRVLEDGTGEPGALANRLVDRRYRDFSAAFGFGDIGMPGPLRAGFADQVADRYLARRFEAAVGETDETMRLALNARREMPALVTTSGDDRIAWLRLLGTPPLRAVMEMALGLPSSTAQLPLDRQVEEMRTAALTRFGSDRMEELTRPEKLEQVLDRFVILDSIGSQQSTPFSPAATILSAMVAGTP
jgi:hypothetical protein